MGKVIGICNQKGGVGKTTTVIAMGRALVDAGYRVLLVDVDDSGNPSLTKGLGIEGEKNLTDLLMFTSMGRSIDDEVEETINKHKEGMDVIAADSELAGMTHFMNNIQDEVKKRRILAEVIDRLRPEYDYILLDAAPSLNIMSINLLTAADEIIIVSQSQGASEEGIPKLMQTVAQVKSTFNKQLIVKGILITMVDIRTNYNRDKAAHMAAEYTELGMKVFSTHIPRAVATESCVEAKESILEYDTNSKPAIAYRAFVQEYLNS